MSKDMIVEHDVDTLDLISLHLLGRGDDINLGYLPRPLQMARLLKVVGVATAGRRRPGVKDERC
jgi:hypothetical protein